MTIFFCANYKLATVETMPDAKKTVHWGPRVEIRHVLDADEYYSPAEADASFLIPQDYDRIRAENQLTLDLIESDLFVETSMRCRRGLEQKTSQGSIQCQSRRREVRLAVLEAQSKHRETTPHDSDALTEASRRASHDARVDAYGVGVSDSNVARVLEALELKEIGEKKKTPKIVTVDEGRYLILLEQRESFREEIKQVFSQVA